MRPDQPEGGAKKAIYRASLFFLRKAGDVVASTAQLRQMKIILRLTSLGVEYTDSINL